MKKPHVTYPCWWTYAVIGPDEEDLRLAIGETVKGLEHRVSFSKLSGEKKFASLHVEVFVSSEEERDRLFKELQSDPRVRWLI